MRAFAIANLEASPAVQQVPDKPASEGEVRVAVEVASVNGFDVVVADGQAWDWMAHTFPVVLGRDFVGTVSEVGDGVEKSRLGEVVAGVVTAHSLGVGSLAESVTVPAETVTKLPEGLRAEEAASLGLAGVAARDVVDAASVEAADTVLVSGATGGVGAVAVQLVKARGGRVIATARPGEEEDFVRGLGVVGVVDYSGDLQAAIRAAAPEGLDKVVHTAGDPVAAARALRPGGALSSLRGVTSEQVGRDDITVVSVVAAATADKLAFLLGELVAGRIKVRASAVFPLEQAAQALDSFRAGTIGKILVRPRQESA
jgi:NADPH:quinone reductase-like Zn-dependent oxidoreductase